MHLASELKVFGEILDTETPIFIEKALSSEARVLATHIGGRLTSLLMLFYWAALDEDRSNELDAQSNLDAEADEENDEENDEEDNAGKDESDSKPSLEYLWIEKLDLADLRSKFPAAFKLYRERIYKKGAPVRMTSTHPFSICEKLVLVLETLRDNTGQVSFASADQLPVTAVCDFYAALGVLTDVRVERVFAPDELLFEPYFRAVSAFHSFVLKDEQTVPRFNQALDYYQADDYKHCVTALGLIAEDYFTRIFSTLLRRECDSNLTLGQIFDNLHRAVSELVQPKPATPKSIEPLYEQLNEHGGDTEGLKLVLRELINVIKEDRKSFAKRIDDVGKPPEKLSPFPTMVHQRVIELLRLRNAASHNTRIAVGRYEADRTLYCLVVIVTWWDKERENIDWAKPHVEVLKALIARARVS